MIQHAAHLEKEYNAGPHTISVPRMRHAEGSDVSDAPPFPVDDANFKKLVAILRIAVPYTVRRGRTFFLLDFLSFFLSFLLCCHPLSLSHSNSSNTQKKKKQGMILSTRESPEMRRELLKCGMSQMSAGSR